jgi:hypothetical protein
MRAFRLFLVVSCFSSVFFGCTRDEDVVLNQVPIANAGPSQTVTLPATVTLTGGGTDADGQILAYLWSQVSGPNTALIANPGAINTAISGIIAGNYVFQLMVTDNDGATGVDTMSLKVNAAPQVTLTLQPANNPNEKMLVSIGGVDQSGVGNSEMVIDAWTVGGSPYYGRNAFKFDLSSIPATAVIESAHLFLYSNQPPQNGNLVDANFGANNSVYLQQITSNWSVGTANWFNQPNVSTSNQISVPHTSLSALDLDIDVTSMVGTMVNTNANYGFLIRLQNEVALTSRAFVSSYHATKVTKHPKLVIVYH